MRIWACPGTLPSAATAATTAAAPINRTTTLNTVRPLDFIRLEKRSMCKRDATRKVLAKPSAGL
jgi:hypothetical protein